MKYTTSTIFALIMALGAHTATAQSDPGAYLAARQAAMLSDFDEAARYYTQGLLADPKNPSLLESAMSSYIALGQIDKAASVARVMRDMEIPSQIGNLVLYADAATKGKWAEIFEGLEAGREVSPLVDGLSQAWAALGQGKMSQALASFDEVIEGEGMKAYGLYHKALALASVGDFEEADKILGTPTAGFGYSARSAVAHAQILSQLDRNADATEVLSAVFGETRDPRVLALRNRLTTGETVPYDLITTPLAGMGEVAFTVATALNNEAPDGYALLYAQVATGLDPDNLEALLLTADLLERLQQFEQAEAAYARVPSTDPAFHLAELGRIDALRNAGKADAAIEVAKGLSRSHAELPNVHTKLGDVLRRESRWAEANAAYTKALDIYPPDDPARWIVLYTRAITFHSMDDWPPAEADFRAALALRPDQPQVLNYLGYSLVERSEKLDEALQMIETAVAAEPDNGAIVDSLGWVYFQLGRYAESVAPLERAASLEAVDPIINDHLGDAYWAVGREIEAVFQWNRALSFEPDEELSTRIRRKLEVGLDAVLIEEGQQPIRVADDDG